MFNEIVCLLLLSYLFDVGCICVYIDHNIIDTILINDLLSLGYLYKCFIKQTILYFKQLRIC